MRSSFAGRLRAALAQAEISQSVLAERSGCSEAAISQYLAGTNIPRPARVEALAKALGVTPEDLTEDTPEPIPIRRVRVRDAAWCMAKSPQFVMEGLRTGKLPFGTAMMGKGSRWNYYINPFKFREYVGVEAFNRCFSREV